MNCLRIISYVALAGKLASGSDAGSERDIAPRTGAVGRVETTATLNPVMRLPQVLKKLEPADNRIIRLPGPAVPRQAPARPAVATVAPAPSAAPDVDLTKLAAKPAVVATVSPSVPRFALPVWHPTGVPSLPPAPSVATARLYTPPAVLNTFVGGNVPVPPRFHTGVSAVIPAEFTQESAVYCQKRIGQWSLDEARALFGEPTRQRPAIDDTDSENGHIYAFRDPTGRYKELELDFGNGKGFLRTVFVYPWNLTWLECRRLWGAKVSATEGNKGRVFYSYLNRHLDVLVDHDGKVISLGLY